MEQRMITWKWHDFMAGFGLMATAILNGLSAIVLFFLGVSGQVTGNAIPVIGSVLVALGAFGAIDDLKAKKKSGVDILLGLYGVNIIVSILVCLFHPETAGSYIGNIVFSAAMLALNKQYYDKRMQYFT